MTQCHYISEGWDCGRPSKERCECDDIEGCTSCIGHSHYQLDIGMIHLMNGNWERIEDFDERMAKIS